MKNATIPCQAEFVARGMTSLADARFSDKYFDAGELMRRLKTKLDAAKKLQTQARR